MLQFSVLSIMNNISILIKITHFYTCNYKKLKFLLFQTVCSLIFTVPYHRADDDLQKPTRVA